MTLTEKIEVMKHYENGGEVEMREIAILSSDWRRAEYPHWNWVDFSYRIKPKPVELLYEWWYKPPSSETTFIHTTLCAESKASNKFLDTQYGKTGRYFNPETKKFGISNL